ncbi:MAG: hypothetical protein QME42_06380 [bacterium]|nr:hypothetical protein [bacterium]
MYREPAFMRDLHTRQEEDYEKTKNLKIHEFVQLVEERGQRALQNWNLKEQPVSKEIKQIVPA